MQTKRKPLGQNSKNSGPKPTPRSPARVSVSLDKWQTSSRPPEGRPGNTPLAREAVARVAFFSGENGVQGRWLGERLSQPSVPMKPTTGISWIALALAVVLAGADIVGAKEPIFKGLG